MANSNTAFGLRPVGLVGASVNSTGVTEYEIASNNTNAIYQFALVVPTSAGVIAYAGATSGGTTQALGVLMGVEYQDSVQKKPVFINYWPGSNSVSVDTNFPVKAFVADNPMQIANEAANRDFTAAGIPVLVRINAHFNAPTSRFDSQTTATSTGI
jgi:hypothetical protein